MIERFLFVDDVQEEVFPVEAGDEGFGRIKFENRFDVVLNPWRCGSGERYTDSMRKRFSEIGEAPVFRAKIVPPLRDAVSLIDSKTINPNPLEDLLRGFHEERLGRNVEHLGFTAQKFFDILLILFFRDGAV